MKLNVAAVMVLSIASSFAGAEIYKHSGEIAKVGSIASRADADFVFVSGFSSAGACRTSNGHVIVRIPNTEQGNRAYSMALAAKMASKPIYVAVDDTVKNSYGECFVQSFAIE